MEFQSLRDREASALYPPGGALSGDSTLPLGSAL